MSPTTREITKGLISGSAFLVSALVMDMPTLLAVGLGAAIYVSLSFLLPKPPQPGGEQAALGLTQEERNRFLTACRQRTSELGQIAGRISNRGFAEQVKELAKTVSALIVYFEKKPESILLAYAVPQNLEHLAAMLRQYAAITEFQQAAGTAEEALKKVEDIFASARASFEGMYQQLINDDLAALETSANTLALLMGVEEEQRKGRASKSDREPPPLKSRQSPTARPTQKERES